jgi:hypothetical protein
VLRCTLQQQPGGGAQHVAIEGGLPVRYERVVHVEADPVVIRHAEARPCGVRVQQHACTELQRSACRVAAGVAAPGIGVGGCASAGARCAASQQARSQPLHVAEGIHHGSRARSLAS